MDLKKCTLNSNGYEESIQCPKGIIKDGKRCKLLGFTNSLPVLVDESIEKHAESKQTVLLNNKTLNVKIGVNAGTGEKFLYTKNGKKFKVVQQSDNIQEIFKTNSLILPDSSNIHNNKIINQIKSSAASSKNDQLITKNPNIKTPLASSPNDLVINKTDISQHVDKDFICRTNNDDKITSQVLSKKFLALGNIENMAVVKTNVVPNTTDAVKLLQKDPKSTLTVLSTRPTIRCYGGAKKVRPINVRTLIQSSNQEKSGKVDQAQQTENTLADVGVQVDLFDILELDVFNCDELLKELNEKPEVLQETVPKPQFNPNAIKFFTELRSALQPDDNGNMPIHVGVLTNNLKLVKRSCFILTALQQSVDIANNEAYTPLQLAIMHDASLEIIQYLLSKGANMNTTDSDGNSILHLATEYQRNAALSILLQHALANSVNLNMFNNEGLTALMIAAINGFYDCADILLEYGADTNIRDQISGRTALFHAAEKHDGDVIQIKQVVEDIVVINTDANSKSLQVAATEGMVKLLLDFHANTKVKNFFGISAHDAMYEIEDMPENIKIMIFGKNLKRKMNDVTNNMRAAKQRSTERSYKVKELKTFPTYEKITEFMITKME